MRAHQARFVTRALRARKNFFDLSVNNGAGTTVGYIYIEQGNSELQMIGTLEELN